MKKAAVKTLVVLAAVVAARPLFKLYAIQEILIILLAIAVTAGVMLLAVAALLLFWEGVHLVFTWLSPTVDTAAGTAARH